MMKNLLLTSLLAIGLSGHALAAPKIGDLAPDFTLADTQGREHSLSDFRGKTVVLEWTNHGCPFVKKHYGSGNMQKLQKAAKDQDVIWLTICSSAPGKQGHMSAAEAATLNQEVGSHSTAYLLDPEGKAGRAYNAKTTPEMFIIDPEGKLVYMGAIDDKPSPNPADIEGANNYVTAALKSVVEGKPVANAQTTPYGCSVKY